MYMLFWALFKYIYEFHNDVVSSAVYFSRLGICPFTLLFYHFFFELLLRTCSYKVVGAFLLVLVVYSLLGGGLCLSWAISFPVFFFFLLAIMFAELPCHFLSSWLRLGWLHAVILFALVQWGNSWPFLPSLLASTLTAFPSGLWWALHPMVREKLHTREAVAGNSLWHYLDSSLCPKNCVKYLIPRLTPTAWRTCMPLL